MDGRCCRKREHGSVMAIHRIRIDYTVYSPNYAPGEGPCWDFGTFTKAKRKARGLGIGALVYRNFNQTNKGGAVGDWWGNRYFWRWTGSHFERLRERGKSVQDDMIQATRQGHRKFA